MQSISFAAALPKVTAGAPISASSLPPLFGDVRVPPTRLARLMRSRNGREENARAQTRIPADLLAPGHFRSAQTLTHSSGFSSLGQRWETGENCSFFK